MRDVKTCVFLNGENGAHMAIGGGHGHYVVYISASDKKFWNLIATETSGSETVSLVVGGQDGNYSARQIVDKSVAVKAAEIFFLNGERDPSLHWELQK